MIFPLLVRHLHVLPRASLIFMIIPRQVEREHKIYDSQLSMTLKTHLCVAFHLGVASKLVNLYNYFSL